MRINHKRIQEPQQDIAGMFAGYKQII